jgi:hypothetical protein
VRDQLWRAGKRLRSQFDQWRYVTVREWPVLASLLGVLLGAATILPTAIGIALSFIAFILGVTVLIRDARALRQRWAAYSFSAIAGPFPATEVPPPASYPTPVYVPVWGRGTLLVSDDVDADLRTNPRPATILPEDYKLPPRLKELAPYALRALNRGKVVFNGTFIGMTDDPIPQSSGKPTPIRLRRASYFDGQCSNEICTLRIVHKSTGGEVDIRRSELRAGDGTLRRLSESDLANGVGISTVAFTTDNYLVTVLQKATNIASALLLAPSGSGALEPRDLPKQEGISSFHLQDILVAGMVRELGEETGITSDEIDGTTVVGFARWLERGARPEFFGYTKLKLHSRDLQPRRLVDGEGLYSGQFAMHYVDLCALAEELNRGVDILQASSIPEALRSGGALPLLGALRASAIAISSPLHVRSEEREALAPGSSATATSNPSGGCSTNSAPPHEHP